MNKSKYRLKATIKVYTHTPTIYINYGEEYYYYFPLEEKKYVIKGLKIPFEITKIEDELVHVICNNEERDFFLDTHKYAIQYNLNENVYFHIYFQLEDNTFTSKSLLKYHLEVNELVLRSQPYYQDKKENNYSLKIIKGKEFVLKETGFKVTIIGIDSDGVRVKVGINDTIKIITLNEDFDYNELSENDPSQSFERTNKEVKIKLIKEIEK